MKAFISIYSVMVMGVSMMLSVFLIIGMLVSDSPNSALHEIILIALFINTAVHILSFSAIENRPGGILE